MRHGRSWGQSGADPGCGVGSSVQSGTGSICTPGVAPLPFLSMPLYHPDALCKEKIEIMPWTKALTAELDIPGQCEQSVEVKPVTIQRDFKSDTCRFHFTGTPIFLAPLAYMFPCWKRSISLFNCQISQRREKQPAFPEHLHPFHIHLQSGADGQQRALNRLRGGTG